MFEIVFGSTVRTFNGSNKAFGHLNEKCQVSLGKRLFFSHFQNFIDDVLIYFCFHALKRNDLQYQYIKYLFAHTCIIVIFVK